MAAELSQAEAEKKAVGEAAADLVADGMVLGLGTGSTVRWFAEAVGARVRDGLKITAIPTSRQSETLASRTGIPLTDWDRVTQIDLCVDGADEIDPAFNMIKGGGGALLWEKIVADAARRRVYIADASKLVPRLGAFPLPVEVVPFGHQHTARRLQEICGDAKLRRVGDVPFLTDGGHLIYDCACGPVIEKPADWHSLILAVPGVVETGLFPWVAQRVITIRDGVVITVAGAGLSWWG